MSATPATLPMTPGALPREVDASFAGERPTRVDATPAPSVSAGLSQAARPLASLPLASLTQPAPRTGSTLSVAPPPLPRRGERRDGLTPNARRGAVLAIITLHLLAVWALLQIREVREAVTASLPMFVSVIAPDAPKPIEPPPPPVARQPVTPKPPAAVISVAPSPAPSTFNVPLPTPVVAEPAPPAPTAPVSVAPVAVAPPPPKVIPTSAIQYLEPIELEYPRLSKRNNEQGLVTIRVYIDETGRAKNASVNRSSGHPRLDDAALAAVQRARFKPYTENGIAVAGWAFIPLEFELEK